MQKFMKKNNESGVGIAEIMVAIVIIVGLLVATAGTFITTSSASSSTNNRNQAIQLSQDVIAVAKQAPWSQLAIWSLPTGGQPSLGTPNTLNADNEIITPGVPSTCSEAWTGSFGGTQVIKTNTYYPKMSWCQSKNIQGTDQDFTVYTYVNYVPANFDSSTAAVTTAGMVYAKKITVKVVWFNGSNDAGQAKWESVTQSYIRSPTIEECVPYSAIDWDLWSIDSIPAGCKYQGIN